MFVYKHFPAQQKCVAFNFALALKVLKGVLFFVAANWGIFIYILLMVGLLSRTTGDRAPMLGTFASILPLAFGYLRFSRLATRWVVLVDLGIFIFNMFQICFMAREP